MDLITFINVFDFVLFFSWVKKLRLDKFTCYSDFNVIHVYINRNGLLWRKKFLKEIGKFAPIFGQATLFSHNLAMPY